MLDQSKAKRATAMMEFAIRLASQSKCTDCGVAAIITDKDMKQIYSIGINGGPAGGMDCLCTLGGKYTCIHAEINALIKCHTEDTHKIMFCTKSPCVTCAAAIVNSGFDVVYYFTPYKDDTGLNILRTTGIVVTQMYRG